MARCGAPQRRSSPWPGFCKHEPSQILNFSSVRVVACTQSALGDTQVRMRCPATWAIEGSSRTSPHKRETSKNRVSAKNCPSVHTDLEILGLPPIGENTAREASSPTQTDHDAEHKLVGNQGQHSKKCFVTSKTNLCTCRRACRQPKGARREMQITGKTSQEHATASVDDERGHKSTANARMDGRDTSRRCSALSGPSNPTSHHNGLVKNLVRELHLWRIVEILHDLQELLELVAASHRDVDYHSARRCTTTGAPTTSTVRICLCGITGRSHTLSKNELKELLELELHVRRDVHTVTLVQYLFSALGWRWQIHRDVSPNFHFQWLSFQGDFRRKSLPSEHLAR